MRFERLLLRAFGPFTDQELDFSGGAPGGLHVVYGPNEAGKSTSLRAVTGFLFGIPHRTSDAHLHPTAKLSIGAEISSGTERFVLTRLKRKKDDLVEQDGSPVLSSPLPRLLGSLDEHSFTSRFGLDQVELERGAEALLGGSEQGLFAAGTAGAQVRHVLDALRQGADDLYKPRGSKPLLNRALIEHERAAREARRAERPPEKWLEQKRAHEEAQARVGKIKTDRHEVRAELRRLNRLRSVFSDLAAWEAATVRLSELGDEPALPPDATELRQECERRLAEAQAEARHIGRELARFEAETEALPPQSPLVEVDDEQLQLSTRAGTALSARKDLPKRQTSLLELVRQVRQLLSELGRSVPEGNELLVAREALPSARTVAMVRSLSTQHGALVTAAHAAERACSMQEREVARLEDAGATRPPSSEALARLEGAIVDAQSKLSLVAALAEDEHTRIELQGEAERLRRQFGVRLPWKDLAPLVPSPAQAAALLSRLQESMARWTSLKERIAAKERSVGLLCAQELERQEADLPSVEKLRDARKKRDTRLDDLEKEATFEGIQGVRVCIEAADQLADRLRHEADRVAAAAALRREIVAGEGDLDTLTCELSDVASVVEAARREHQDLCGAFGFKQAIDAEQVPALCEGIRRLVEVEAKGESLDESIAQKKRRVSEQEGRLRQTLTYAAPDALLPALLAAAAREHREGLQLMERSQQKKEDLSRAQAALEQARAQHHQCARELATWEEHWKAAMVSLGLTKEATVSAAQDMLSTLEKLGRVLQEATNLEGRIAGMKRDTQALADDVRAVLRRHLPELLEMDPVDAAIQLQEEIRAARRVSDERVRCRRLIAERRSSLAKVEAVIGSAEGQLRRLVQAAGVNDASELPQAEERRREIHSLKQKLDALERSIHEKAEGTSISELRDEAREWNGRAGPLNQRVYDLEEQMEELDEEFRSAESDEASIEMGLSIYSSEDVVDARQRSVSRASEARALLRQYLVQQAAYSLLRQQMEAYAERFAGPIFGRASEIFKRMTLGRYTKLTVGIGQRTLRCVREGQELEVSQLSRGTRAQLYFALRLASLEAYFSEHPTVPLVFDDLFVDFDDDRATAAFEVLVDLASRVQVLYFTHLARDVEAAHNAVPKHLLFEHRIGVA